MYHRIAVPEVDVWEINVSPAMFEQQLQVLKKMGNVVPLQQLVNEINAGKLHKNRIAITFDDGYIDNFTVAKPFLEKYCLPATFFISSGNIGTEKEYWWDELEHLILFTQHLPPFFSLQIRETIVETELKTEVFLDEELRQKHGCWKACTEEPPTIRAKLFYKLWQTLRPLPAIEQQQYLQNIQTWINKPKLARPEYRTMSIAELKELATDDLFTIGAHTVTHPALADHSAQFQKKELLENRYFLSEITGREINLLAYPYGNYNEQTLTIAPETGFNAAFTTEEMSIKSGYHKYSFGRLQVKNLPGAAFGEQLKHWKLY